MNDNNLLVPKKQNQQTINIDDVARVAYKIGLEIWGENQFLKMMSVSYKSMQQNTEKENIA